MVTPNRIQLITHGRYDEAVSSADCYPGMALQQNSSLAVAPAAVIGGGVSPKLICLEDALQGGDATQKIASGNVTPMYRPIPGDLVLMLLQNGQNVAANVPLISAGDGTLITSPGSVLYEIEAPSTVITNLGTETAFSNGSYTFPANLFAVGDVIHIRSKVFCIAENSTNTHRIRLYLGATPVTLADSTALALAANDYVLFDLVLTIRTITASGTFIGDVAITYTVSGTVTETESTIVSTTLDSTVSELLVIKSLASATSAGNQVRLDEFLVSITKAGGMNTFAISQEAINNSSGAGSSPMSAANAGTAAFIRCMIP